MSDIKGWRYHYEQAELLLKKSKQDDYNISLRELMTIQAQAHATLSTIQHKAQVQPIEYPNKLPDLF